MNLRGIQTMALLLWGWQSELLLFAVPMAIIWEARFFLNRRWHLSKQDFYLLADLTAVCLVLMITFLFLNRADYHFISTLMQWLPILLFPLTVTVGYSTEERLSLDVLFYSLRRQKQPVNQSWDMDYLLFGFLIVAAGTSKDLGIWFFPLVSLLVFFALLPLRSRRYTRKVWVLVCTLVFLSAFLTQAGIRETHVELRKRAQVWLAQWIQQRTNPLKSHTAIGQIGRLKLSDEILYRIPAPVGQPMPGYLQEAVYDFYGGTSWSVLETEFSTIETVDDFLWDTGDFDPGKDVPLDIYHEFTREKEVIPVPPGVTRIQDLPAIDVQRNYYGAMQGLGLVPSPRYQTFFNYNTNQTSPPTPADFETSADHERLLEQIIADNQLDREKPLTSIRRFFADFRYSLYQQEYLLSDPLEDFLLRRKSGHCEFFATSTVLLLRQMGIPARYATGYAIEEYDDLLDMYVVRQRHAHAWVLAYINDRWQAIDTTPAVWLATEEAQSTFFQPVLDTFGNLSFMFQIWWNKQSLDDYEAYLYGIGVLLGLILLWRISTGEQVLIKSQDDDSEPDQTPAYPISPLQRVEQQLNQHGLSRQPGELFSAWFNRIGHEELLGLLPLHYKLRFHPAGVTTAERTSLEQQVQASIQRIEAKYSEN
ncbi:MAG: transglutaminase-like domain-containing protein [Pseudomonadales bacterium]